MNEYKKILLIKVPFCEHPDYIKKQKFDFKKSDTFRPIPSLALASICSFFNKYKTLDYTLKAVDLNIEGYETPNIPIDINVYKKLLNNCISNNPYDILAISIMLVYNIRWLEEAVKLSRNKKPSAKIIVGGGYPTIFPKMIFEKHEIDFAVIGEGEATFLHLINRINNHKDEKFEKKFTFNYAYKDETNKVIVVSRKEKYLDMEDLPPPDWDFINVKRYFKKSGDKILPIEGIRGCPYSCTYCCTYLSWGRKIRRKSTESLINEIVETYNKYNHPTRHFVDDNMSFDKPWIISFLKRLTKLNLDMEIVFSNFSVLHLNEEILDILKEVGVKQLAIAVETGSKEIQKRIKKNLDFDRVREVVKMLKQRKFFFTIGWMIGFPGETLQQIDETFNLARELRANSNAFNIVLPYPGTKLYFEAKNNNLLAFDGEELDNFGYRKAAYVKSSEWTNEQIQEMKYDATIEMTYLNNPFLETSENMDYVIIDFERRLKKIPGHIIAHIVLGYIYNIKDNKYEYEKHYNLALKHFENKELNNTFYKYLSWEHPIINHFNQYIKAKGIKINNLNF